LRNKVSVGEYLAFLSLKYDVDPDQFFNAISSAWEKQKAKCGELLIECRGKKQDSAIFLMTRNSKVLAQFPIPREFLLEQANPIRNYRTTGMIHRHTSRENDGQYPSCIKNLRAGMKKINLRAKILEIPKPTLVFTRFGNYASVANAFITDETGRIKLCLWNEQISSISVGDTVQIENAHMSLFRGEPQLRIGKNGKVSVVEKMEPEEIQS